MSEIDHRQIVAGRRRRVLVGLLFASCAAAWASLAVAAVRFL